MLLPLRLEETVTSNYATLKLRHKFKASVNTKLRLSSYQPAISWDFLSLTRILDDYCANHLAVSGKLVCAKQDSYYARINDLSKVRGDGELSKSVNVLLNNSLENGI